LLCNLGHHAHDSLNFFLGFRISFVIRIGHRPVDDDLTASREISFDLFGVFSMRLPIINCFGHFTFGGDKFDNFGNFFFLITVAMM
jgi:hypothetical protein